jgi:hypothetical protein
MEHYTMTNETTEAVELSGYKAGSQDFTHSKSKEKGLPDGITMSVYFPSLEEIQSLLIQSGQLGDTVRTAVSNGMKQIFRNHGVGGYPAPISLAVIESNEVARAAAAKDKGAALGIRRDAINSFVAFITAQGVPAAAVAKCAGWLNSKDMNALAAQNDATRNNIHALAGAWIGSLSEAEQTTFSKLIATLDTALKGETVEADAFAVG